MKIEYISKEYSDVKSFLVKKGLSFNIVNSLLKNKKNVYINGVSLYSLFSHFQKSQNSIEKSCENNSKNGFFTWYSIKPEDEISIVFEDEQSSVVAVDKPINVIFEDEYFLVVNKEKNLACIPTRAHFDDNLASRVKNYYDKKNAKCGIHLINRLDLPTCGLVVFAKNNYVHSVMREVDIVKKYKALAYGIFEHVEGVIDLKIGKTEPYSIKRTALSTCDVSTQNGENKRSNDSVFTANINEAKAENEAKGSTERGFSDLCLENNGNLLTENAYDNTKTIDISVKNNRYLLFSDSRFEDGGRLIDGNKFQTAITKYKVLAVENGNSLVELTLLTGRTHQIRVHLSAIGHPLLGDKLYNDKQKSIDENEFYLCSYYLSFTFPLSGKTYTFEI